MSVVHCGVPFRQVTALEGSRAPEVTGGQLGTVKLRLHLSVPKSPRSKAVPAAESGFATEILQMAHEQFASCIAACNDCADACDHCASACLQERNVADLARCIRLDLDCAAICRVAAGAVARGSELAPQICQACADVCDACAQECERHTKMIHCKECADACRRCADECRRMASAAGKTTRRPQSGAGAPAH